MKTIYSLLVAALAALPAFAAEEVPTRSLPLRIDEYPVRNIELASVDYGKVTVAHVLKDDCDIVTEDCHQELTKDMIRIGLSMYTAEGSRPGEDGKTRERKVVRYITIDPTKVKISPSAFEMILQQKNAKDLFALSVSEPFKKEFKYIDPWKSNLCLTADSGFYCKKQISYFTVSGTAIDATVRWTGGVE